MILQTYQSKVVLRTLKNGEVYRAKPNLSLRREYDALIDMLGLHCECPVFAVVKGKKQNTGGKVSGSVRLTLDVPEEFVHITEYGVWADFIYAFKFSKPGNYKVLRPDCEACDECAEQRNDAKPYHSRLHFPLIERIVSRTMAVRANDFAA